MDQDEADYEHVRQLGVEFVFVFSVEVCVDLPFLRLQVDPLTKGLKLTVISVASVTLQKI